MSTQQSILRFVKRPAANTPDSFGDSPNPKQRRVESKDQTSSLAIDERGCINHTNGTKSRCAINKFVAEMKLKLSPAVKTLIKNMDPEWCFHLSKVIQTDGFSRLANFIEQERAKTIVYPPQDEVFTWSKLTPPRQVRVVILGQDPYHGPNQAHGLAFSVKRPVRPPPSLVNMYQEVAADWGIGSKKWPPSHGDLTRWAEQGVLLLNAVLTVRASQPNSHKDAGWEKLTAAVIDHINKNCSNVVFLLWGAFAQAQGVAIDRSRHLVLHAPHPSPFSANRGFFGCKHFSKANLYLQQHGLEPINWAGLD